MVCKTRALETFALMTCDDVLAVLSALVVGWSAAKDASIEIETGEKSLNAVLAYASVVGCGIRHIGYDVFQLAGQPCVKLDA